MVFLLYSIHLHLHKNSNRTCIAIWIHIHILSLESIVLIPQLPRLTQLVSAKVIVCSEQGSIPGEFIALGSRVPPTFVFANWSLDVLPSNG